MQQTGKLHYTNRGSATCIKETRRRAKKIKYVKCISTLVFMLITSFSFHFSAFKFSGYCTVYSAVMEVKLHIL